MARRHAVTPTRLSFRAPKRTPNEIPWEPAYQYECSNGHRLYADTACCSCPACIHGEACGGELTRVGPGSRTVTP